MDLSICSIAEALQHQADKPTYVIRIFSSWHTDFHRMPLQASDSYVHVAEYVFDDNDEQFQSGPVWFDDTIAGKIISDFASHQEGLGALLVHCSKGQNRSPAVAMALNDIFGLGHDTDALKERYRAYNRFVYEKLMEFSK